MTNDQPPTAETITSGPQTITVTWHPDAVQRAVDHATAVVLDQGIPADDTPVHNGAPLTWMDIACLLDIARAFERQGDEVDKLRAEIQQLNSHPWCTSEHDNHGCALLRGHDDDHTDGTKRWPNNAADHLAGDLHDSQATNPEPPRCSAHGYAACPSCSLNPANCGDPNTFGDCFSYATDGMHGDTCPNRVRTAPEEVNRG